MLPGAASSPTLASDFGGTFQGSWGVCGKLLKRGWAAERRAINPSASLAELVSLFHTPRSAYTPIRSGLHPPCPPAPRHLCGSPQRQARGVSLGQGPVYHGVFSSPFFSLPLKGCWRILYLDVTCLGQIPPNSSIPPRFPLHPWAVYTLSPVSAVTMCTVEDQPLDSGRPLRGHI